MKLLLGLPDVWPLSLFIMSWFAICLKSISMRGGHIMSWVVVIQVRGDAVVWTTHVTFNQQQFSRNLLNWELFNLYSSPLLSPNPINQEDLHEVAFKPDKLFPTIAMNSESSDALPSKRTCTKAVADRELQGYRMFPDGWALHVLLFFRINLVVSQRMGSPCSTFISHKSSHFCYWFFYSGGIYLWRMKSVRLLFRNIKFLKRCECLASLTEKNSYSVDAWAFWDINDASMIYINH